MATPNSRRRFLRRFSLGIAATVAGCTAPSNQRPTDVDTTTLDDDESENASVTCSLNHDVLEKNREHRIEDHYRYEALSDTAQSFFKKALEKGVRYQNESTEDAPPEFAYTDVVTKYKITYGEEVYVLGTWSGDGCSINT